MWTTYWFEITDENSDLWGEEFFTELKTSEKSKHIRYAKEIFPDVKIECLGKVTAEEAEMMGLDTY
jgi:ribulose kinase